jgi:FlaA1/EpsC-like NDP-sugar epimerase
VFIWIPYCSPALPGSWLLVLMPAHTRATGKRWQAASAAVTDRRQSVLDACRPVLCRLTAAAIARRFPLVVATHAVLIVMASYLACWLRFDGDIPPALFATYLQTLPSVLAIRGLTFVPFRLYGGLWRYTSVWDLSRIVLGVVTSSLALHVLVYGPLGPHGYPRSLVIIDSILLISFLGGVRLLWRIVPGAVRAKRGRRVLVLGAGDAGEMIVREMRKDGGYQPVGFIDDDPSKVGSSIHGVMVLGTRDELPRVVAATKPHEVLVGIPTADPAVVRDFVRLLEPFNLPITTLPTLEQLVNGKISVKHIRPLAIEDLLPRSQVTLDAEQAQRLVRGRRVLVTGAGGSIGSELCRQIATLDPESLILYERYENSLYQIATELVDRGVTVPIHPAIGDITDAGRVDAVFAEHRPHLVFHAAAHKHVPLMEANPCEAVKNNVLGTRTIAEAAREYRVERFVLVSTDKAANPSSVMGATKRVAELTVAAVSAGARTRFVTVRFGNVLGSNGSVIPRMLEQIRTGGPVTVTHPEIRRYFMLIPEAVQLVLQAAALARGRETFVLDMGEPIKVLDVARNLIRLSGFVPDQDIPIAFVGLRPGEKLVEELVGEGEQIEPAGTDKLFRVPWPTSADLESLANQAAALVRVATSGRSQDVITQLRLIVPTFHPAGLAAREAVAAAVVLSQPRAGRAPLRPRVAPVAVATPSGT